MATSEKVRQLRGVTSARPPVQPVVEALEAALALARAGELRMVAIVEVVETAKEGLDTSFEIGAAAGTHLDLLRGAAARMLAEWID